MNAEQLLTHNSFLVSLARRLVRDEEVDGSIVRVWKRRGAKGELTQETLAEADVGEGETVKVSLGF